MELLSQIEPINQFLILILIGIAKILQKFPALNYHFEETAPRMLIFPIQLEMLAQRIDPLG